MPPSPPVLDTDLPRPNSPRRAFSAMFSRLSRSSPSSQTSPGLPSSSPTSSPPPTRSSSRRHQLKTFLRRGSTGPVPSSPSPVPPHSQSNIQVPKAEERGAHEPLLRRKHANLRKHILAAFTHLRPPTVLPLHPPVGLSSHPTTTRIPLTERNIETYLAELGAAAATTAEGDDDDEGAQGRGAEEDLAEEFVAVLGDVNREERKGKLVRNVEMWLEGVEVQ